MLDSGFDHAEDSDRHVSLAIGGTFATRAGAAHVPTRGALRRTLALVQGD